MDGPEQPAVYYVTKEQPWIVPITNPASANPVAEVVGYTADGRKGGESIAVGALDGPDGPTQAVVYVGEAAA